MSKSILLSLSSPISADQDAEFNTWYNTVHAREILALDGFSSIKRYKVVLQAMPPAEEPAYAYITVFEVEDAGSAAQKLMEAAPGLTVTEAMDPERLIGFMGEEIFSMDA